MELPKKRNAIFDVKTKIPRNGNGGVYVSEEEIELAFKFFQRFSEEENSQKINVTDVKKGFAALCKPLQKKDVDALFLDKNSFTLDDLKTLLKENPITKDPIDEAFSILAGGSSNSFLSEARLRKIFTNLDFGSNLTKEELILLIELADSDRDGKIGSEDFRLLARPKQSKQKTSSK